MGPGTLGVGGGCHPAYPGVAYGAAQCRDQDGPCVRVPTRREGEPDAHAALGAHRDQHVIGRGRPLHPWGQRGSGRIAQPLGLINRPGSAERNPRPHPSASPLHRRRTGSVCLTPLPANFGRCWTGTSAGGVRAFDAAGREDVGLRERLSADPSTADQGPRSTTINRAEPNHRGR
jgi:hypothetical protein